VRTLTSGAFLFPLLLVAIISWPRPTAVTAFPHTELGNSNFDYFKQVVDARGFKLLGPHNVDWNAYSVGKVWVAIVSGRASLSCAYSWQISFLYVDLLDTTGTTVAMAKQAKVFDVREGDFEGSSAAFLVDSACISISGLFFGTSPCTPFVESASGISEGGRTGLTAIATAFWFFISIFFSPILSNIPSWATGSVLVIVGAFMMENATRINWDYLGDSLPAFLVLAVIPFSCKFLETHCRQIGTQLTPDNIAYGVIAGLVTFILLHNIPMLLGKISPRLLPPGWEDLKDPYNIGAMIKQQDTHGHSKFFALLPPWLRKALSGNRKFWELTPQEIERRLEGRRMAEDSGDAAAELRQKERDGLRLMLGIYFTRPDSPASPPRQQSYDVEGARSDGGSERKSANTPNKEPGQLLRGVDVL